MRARRAAAALGTLALTGGLLLAAGAPAYADAIFVEVNPTTIQAGSAVSIRASCGAGVDAATVRSAAFGEITLVKHDDFLTATVPIPGDQQPRGYHVRLSCPSTNTATTTLWVVGMPAPTKGPHTGGGFLARGGTAAAGEPPVLAIGGGVTALGLALSGWFVWRRRTRVPA